MKTKYALAVFLILPFLAFAGWIFTIQKSLNAEHDVVIRMRGYDPRDLLSGHYLLLRPDWEQTDCSQFYNEICPRSQFAASYRYYLPEFDAVQLDKLLNEKSPATEMVFAYRKTAKPMVKKLLIEGSDWKDWLNRFSKSLNSEQTSD